MALIIRRRGRRDGHPPGAVRPGGGAALGLRMLRILRMLKYVIVLYIILR